MLQKFWVPYHLHVCYKFWSQISNHTLPYCSTLGWLITAAVVKFASFKTVSSVRANVVNETVRGLRPHLSYKFLNHHHSSTGTSYQDKIRACTLPGQRPNRSHLLIFNDSISNLLLWFRNRILKLPHRLKKYPVADDLRQCVLMKEDLTFVRPKISDVSMFVCLSVQLWVVHL